MSEIEKMYENAGVLKECLAPCYINKTWRKTHDCPNCDNRENYPPFTAEKQISLIKFLMKQEDFSWTIAQQGKDTEYVFYVSYEFGSGDFKEFTEALAGIINDIWQDLTEEEKQQVKGILE